MGTKQQNHRNRRHIHPYSEAPLCQISYSQPNNFHIYASLYFLFNIKKIHFNLIFHSFCVHIQEISGILFKQWNLRISDRWVRAVKGNLFSLSHRQTFFTSPSCDRPRISRYIHTTTVERIPYSCTRKSSHTEHEEGILSASKQVKSIIEREKRESARTGGGFR